MVPSIKKVLNVILISLILLSPIVYLAILNLAIPQSSIKFHAGWEDNSFQNGWRLASNKPVNASILSENGILKVYANGNLSAGTIVTAQRIDGLEFNLDTYRYLKVSIMTSGPDVAAIIEIWTGPDLDYLHTVLLKTYNDGNWHTEIIDLLYFGIYGSGLFMIELGWMQVYEGSSSMACYSQLSFNSLEVT
ncbi:MAG: hypothetical protein H3Z54_11270 [archaeon]|nr:hypothetical protein [archaeon]